MADSTLRAATVCYDMQTTAVGDRRSRVRPAAGAMLTLLRLSR